LIISLLLLKTSAGPILSDLPPKLLWGVASSAGFMTAGPGEILSTGGSDSSFLPVWGDTDEAVKGRQKGGCLFGLKVGFFLTLILTLILIITLNLDLFQTLSLQTLSLNPKS